MFWQYILFSSHVGTLEIKIDRVCVCVCADPASPSGPCRLWLFRWAFVKAAHWSDVSVAALIMNCEPDVAESSSTLFAFGPFDCCSSDSLGTFASCLCISGRKRAAAPVRQRLQHVVWRQIFTPDHKHGWRWQASIWTPINHSKTSLACDSDPKQLIQHDDPNMRGADRHAMLTFRYKDFLVIIFSKHSGFMHIFNIYREYYG